LTCFQGFSAPFFFQSHLLIKKRISSSNNCLPIGSEIFSNEMYESANGLFGHSSLEPSIELKNQLGDRKKTQKPVESLSGNFFDGCDGSVSRISCFDDFFMKLLLLFFSHVSDIGCRRSCQCVRTCCAFSDCHGTLIEHFTTNYIVLSVLKKLP
jgi:hypothetical protein